MKYLILAFLISAAPSCHDENPQPIVNATYCWACDTTRATRSVAGLDTTIAYAKRDTCGLTQQDADNIRANYSIFSNSNGSMTTIVNCYKK